MKTALLARKRNPAFSKCPLAFLIVPNYCSITQFFCMFFEYLLQELAVWNAKELLAKKAILWSVIVIVFPIVSTIQKWILHYRPSEIKLYVHVHTFCSCSFGLHCVVFTSCLYNFVINTSFTYQHFHWGGGNKAEMTVIQTTGSLCQLAELENYCMHFSLDIQSFLAFLCQLNFDIL